MSHADVVTRLVLNDDQHEAAIKQARGSIERFASGARERLASLGSVYAALGVGAAVGFATAAVKSQMDVMDATGKLADRLGTTTEGLQALRHAAEATGAGSAVLDASLSKLTVNLGLAQQGTGDAVNAFKALGLDVDDLASKDPASAFADIAEALEKVPSSTQKMAIVTKIFGEGGGGLLNTLALGKQGLADMATEADKLGMTFSRVDAAKVEAANDAVARLTSAFNGFFIQATADLSPFITMSSDDLTSGVAEVNAELDATGQKLGIVGKIAGTVADVVDVVTDVFKAGQAAMLSYYASWANGIAGVLELAAKLPNAMGGSVFKDAADTARVFADSMKDSANAKWDEAAKAFTDKTPSERAAELAAKMDQAGEAAKRTAQATQAISSGTGTATNKLDALLDQWTEKIDNFGKADRRVAIDKLIAEGADDEAIGKLTELEEHAKAMDLGKSLAESLRTPAEELQAKLDEYDKLLPEKAIDDQTAARARAKAKDDYDKATGIADLEEQTRTREEKLSQAMGKLNQMWAEGQFEGREDLYDRAAKMYQEQYGPEKQKESGRRASFEGLDSLYKRIAASSARGSPATTWRERSRPPTTAC